MIRIMKIIICLMGILIFSHTLCAQNIMTDQNNKYYIKAEQIKDQLAKGESGYKLIFYLKNKINDDNVHIFRFEPEPSKRVTLKGPHVTVIIDDNLRLKGFARLNESMTGKNNISESDGMVQALLFLNKYAPDLKDSKYQWSAPHEEKVIGADRKEKTINGTWVKYREQKTGQYLWVILAPDQSIMEFDRDIVWSFFRGGRVNELWLRDEWFGKWLSKNKK